LSYLKVENMLKWNACLIFSWGQQIWALNWGKVIGENLRQK
jgi:hypothetical protein